MPDYATQALYCCAATNVSLQKLLSLHKSMQVGVGVQSYKRDDRDREYNYSLKSYLNSVLNVTLVHVPHWSGVVPP